MFQTLTNAWRLPDLRKRLLFTFSMLIVFRIGSLIPVPNVSADAIKQMLGLGQGGGGNIFELWNTMSGGALENASILAMSITPYINASIIMQLLTVAIPALERLSREGDEGRKILAQWTRYGTVVLGFIQAAGLYVGLVNMKAIANNTPINFFMVTLSFTAGTAFLMWLGEKITEKGIGNGISLIIFAGIVARGPDMIQYAQKGLELGNYNWFTLGLLVVLGLIVIAFVVTINSAERRIPVQYAKRVVGRKMYGGQSTHIPLKVAMAGVIPIIFASSIMAFPSTIARLFTADTSKLGGFWGGFLNFISPTSWFYAVMYFILIVAFTYFYTAIQFNPIEISNNLKRNGGFIPGLRPGKPTSDFVQKVLGKVTFIGAIAIAFIAVLPLAMGGKGGSGLSFGGTSLLIVVGVALETYRQIEAQMLMRHYKGFLE